MAEFSFIDHGNKDFLRDRQGKPLVKEFADAAAAERWLVVNGSVLGWSNEGTRIYNWDDE